MQRSPELAQQLPPLVGERGPQASRGVQCFGQLQELAGLQAAPPRSPFDGRTDVVRRADSHRRPLRKEGPGLVGLVEAARDDHRIRRRLQCFRQPSTGREGCRIGQSRPDLRKLEQLDRAGVHDRQRVPRGPDSAGLSAR